MSGTQITPEITGTHSGVLCEMNHEGDSRLMWDKDKPEEVGKARERFDELLKKGYMGYRVQGNDRGEVLRSFDADAERIIMAPPLAGG